MRAILSLMRKTRQGDGRFALLFKKYRLRSEFETLAEFGDAMSEAGFVYENSLYSRWQKGTRVPGDRQVLLAVVVVFMKRGGIVNLKEANAFLEAAGQGYLTDSEIEKLPASKFKNIPFQAPREIDNFSGREEYINLVRELLLQNKSILLWGGAGVGKTSLAIKLAHLLRGEFTDGVLWCRLDTSNTMNILSSIAYAYGEDISGIKDLASRASLVRSMLSGKRVLLILDNAERDSELDLVMPNSSSCAVIMTSQDKTISLHCDETISLNHFTDKEAFSLYTKVLGEEYVKEHTDQLKKIANFGSNLPLALHIIAKQLKDGQVSIEGLIERIEEEKIKLSDFSYHSKDLYAVLNVRVDSLDEQQKKIFYSLGIFGGKDFSLQPVAAINGMKIADVQKIIQQLVNYSIVEYSIKNRYRIHPFIRLYLQEKLHIPIYKKAAKYFINLLSKEHNIDLYFYQKIQPDLDLVFFIFKKTYKYGFLQEALDLGWHLGVIFWNRGNWNDTQEVARVVYLVAKKTHNYKIQVLTCIRELSWVYYWTGEIDKALKYTQEGLELAEKNEDVYMTAYAKERLGRVLLGKHEYDKGIHYLSEAHKFFIETGDIERIANCERYIGEAYMFLNNLVKAENFFLQTIDKYKVINRIPMRHIFLSIVYVHLGIIKYREGKYSLALSEFMKSLELRKNGGRGWANLWAMLGVALIFENKGNLAEAAEYFNRAHKEMLYLGLNSHYDSISVYFLLMKNALDKSKLYHQVFRTLV